MKVLEVCQEFPNKYYPQLGTFIKQSIDAIANQNIDLTVISPKPFMLPISKLPYYNFYKLPQQEFTPNYTIHYPRYLYFVPKKYFYPLSGISYCNFVSNYVYKNVKLKHDLIHAHFSYPDGYGMIKLAQKWEVPLVISALGTIERKVAYEGSQTSQMIIEALNFADDVLSVSEELKVRISDLGVSKNKIHVVPNGVNLEKFKPINKEHARRKLNLPPDKKIVLYVGSLRKIKGLEYLIEASKNFLNHETILLLVGRDDGLKDILIKKAKDLNIVDYVKFVNQIKHDQIPLWMSASDIFVLPSLSEGRPNVVLEALACCVPVVATKVGGTPELINNNENGFLVKEEDPDGLSEKIIVLLNDPKLRSKMGLNGRKSLVENGLTWEAHAIETQKIYSKLV